MSDQKQKRDKRLPGRISADELDLLDRFKDSLQLVTRGKVSRVDAIVKAVKFALGETFI